MLPHRPHPIRPFAPEYFERISDRSECAIERVKKRANKDDEAANDEPRLGSVTMRSFIRFRFKTLTLVAISDFSNFSQVEVMFLSYLGSLRTGVSLFGK
jgi:hypothetical protein